MNAIANGWQGAALNLALVLGMLYSRSQLLERILFAVFIFLSGLTIRVIVIRARSRNLY
jgi:hypothetical protein